MKRHYGRRFGGRVVVNCGAHRNSVREVLFCDDWNRVNCNSCRRIARQLLASIAKVNGRESSGWPERIEEA